ncbi:MAG: putative transposase [Bacilli bacterium]|nr:putative transposase [Bacilli bacterium]
MDLLGMKTQTFLTTIVVNEKELSKENRQIMNLNNIVEQDHRFIKKITNHLLGFKSFQTAEKTLAGIEAFHMLRKQDNLFHQYLVIANVRGGRRGSYIF